MKTLLITLGTTGLLALSVTAHAAIDDAKAADIMKKSGCASCHAVDKKVIGPAYKDVAAKHKGDAGAAASLEKIVRAGSKGTYGPMPMPPNPESRISDGDLHDMIAWILSQ